MMETVLALVWCVALVAGQEVLVEVRQGVLRGERAYGMDGSQHLAFTTIPYAKPPLGPLRFQDPEPAEGWEGVRAGPKWTPACPQLGASVYANRTFSAMGQEDCLFLNVYTPALPDGDAPLKPVLVWLAMGGFSGGSSAMYQATPLVTRDIVLVTVQYRVGILGFLATDDNTVRGNFGLKDQAMALRWVRDNIDRFGGDPGRVTLAGDEASSAAVHYQVLSPRAEGLFQRAIMHSGISFGPSYYREDHGTRTLKLAKELNCTDDSVSMSGQDTADVIDCLRNATAEELIKAFWTLGDFEAFPFPMVPRVDGDFIPAHPAQLLRDGRYSKVDMMVGVVKDQGAAIVRGMEIFSDLVKNISLDFVDGMGMQLFHTEGRDRYLTQRAIYQYYPDNTTDYFSPEAAPYTNKLLGDGLFKSCFYDALKFHARDNVFGKKVFAFELQHKSENSYFDQMYGPPPDWAKDWIVVDDDMQYLFNWWLTSKQLTNPEDLFVRKIMLDMWTNFVHHGHPTPDLSLGFRWEAAGSSDTRLLGISLTPTMQPIDAQTYEFWKTMPTKKNKFLYPEQF